MQFVTHGPYNQQKKNLKEKLFCWVPQVMIYSIQGYFNTWTVAMDLSFAIEHMVIYSSPNAVTYGHKMGHVFTS